MAQRRRGGVAYAPGTNGTCEKGMMNAQPLRLIPLGGLGEIGKNMFEIEYGDDILLVDTGLMFPENDMLGIDYIIPDFRTLIEKKDRVRGIVVTHGHEDHTGAIRHVLEEIHAPIYATPLTRGLLEVKLARGGMLQEADLHTINAGDRVSIGPFEVEFFHVCHSIPDGVGLGIHTPAGLIVHSGDFKFDHTPVDGWPTDFGKLADLGGQGVLALLANSTNADDRGWTPSETVIDAAFEAVFRQADGRILIGTFASLISRMAQVAKAAEKSGRLMAFVGTSMQENARIARKLGYLDIPDELIVPIDQALGMKARRTVLMCTGTQGEPSSILGRLSTGTNRQFDLRPDDTVILSSHPIPGNEEMVHRTINRLYRARGGRHLRRHRPGARLRACQPGGDETPAPGRPAEVLHPDPRGTAPPQAARRAGARGGHSRGEHRRRGERHADRIPRRLDAGRRAHPGGLRFRRRQRRGRYRPDGHARA